jgi:ATP-dependent Clp protease protease subunit
MRNENDFRKYAVKHLGMNGSRLDSYMNITSDYGYISPTIIEERQLNVAQMDVFSRLMMDRIIFLGTQINEYTANVVQAQLLYLDSSDPGKDISLYINSPGGTVYAGYGIYDTMQFISSDVSTICTGIAASMAAVLLVAGTPKKPLRSAAFARHDTSTVGRCTRPRFGYRNYRARNCTSKTRTLYHHLPTFGSAI